MALNVEIAGRMAIPVRAIPCVAGVNLLPPDVVAEMLSQRSEAKLFRENLSTLTAHRLDTSGLRDILPKEWDAVVDDIQALVEKLKPEDKSEDAAEFVEWRRQALLCIPADCFVWQDEFESAFNNDYKKEGFHARGLADERPGDRELNYFPLLPRDICEKDLVAGFISKRITFTPPPATGSYIIRFPADVDLLAVEDVFDAIALVKYGALPDDSDEAQDEAYWMAVETGKMECRTTLKQGFRDGLLTARRRDKTKMNTSFQPSDFEPMDEVYVARDEMAVFAAAEWMVKIQDESPQIEQDETQNNKPVSRSHAQNEAILAALRASGIDPLSMPPLIRGKAGTRAQIRERLGSKGMWAGSKVFDKAWERLARNGDIAYKK